MTTRETLILRRSTRILREYVTADGDMVIAKQLVSGQWLVTATAEGPHLSQVQGRVTFNEAGFHGRQWESQIDGQQHASLIDACRAAVSDARQREDTAVLMAAANVGPTQGPSGPSQSWSYRSSALYGPTYGDALSAIRAEAFRAVPADVASLEITDIRLTPTGRYSALVTRSRYAPAPSPDRAGSVSTVPAPDPKPASGSQRGPVMVLRSVAFTEEEAAVFKVALALLSEHPEQLLTVEGLGVLRDLHRKADELLVRFPVAAR